MSDENRAHPFLYGAQLLLHDADREDPVAAADVVDRIQPLDHAAEAGVAAVEVLRVFAVHADEELRAAGILAGMRHREDAAVVILARRRGLALDAVSRAARTVAARAAALDDEVGDHAVEGQAVVESVFGQFDEVGHCAGGLVRVKFGLHRSLLGGDQGVLFLFGHIVERLVTDKISEKFATTIRPGAKNEKRTDPIRPFGGGGGSRTVKFTKHLIISICVTRKDYIKRKYK